MSVRGRPAGRTRLMGRRSSAIPEKAVKARLAGRRGFKRGSRGGRGSAAQLTSHPGGNHGGPWSRAKDRYASRRAGGAGTLRTKQLKWEARERDENVGRGRPSGGGQLRLSSPAAGLRRRLRPALRLTRGNARSPGRGPGGAAQQQQVVGAAPSGRRRRRTDPSEVVVGGSCRQRLAGRPETALIFAGARRRPRVGQASARTPGRTSTRQTEYGLDAAPESATKPTVTTFPRQNTLMDRGDGTSKKQGQTKGQGRRSISPPTTATYEGGDYPVGRGRTWTTCATSKLLALGRHGADPGTARAKDNTLTEDDFHDASGSSRGRLPAVRLRAAAVERHRAQQLCDGGRRPVSSRRHYGEHGADRRRRHSLGPKASRTSGRRKRNLRRHQDGWCTSAVPVNGANRGRRNGSDGTGGGRAPQRGAPVSRRNHRRGSSITGATAAGRDNKKRPHPTSPATRGSNSITHDGLVRVGVQSAVNQRGHSENSFSQK